ncbi:GNAT family N-acetyltransferase [Novosphingobium sp. BL-8H]|uniref:GNAT family N-acetyltransferase n=1 Tax=Novosphingobium sp. BL-8H TaxID=3127640 RepID=UPI0037567529
MGTGFHGRGYASEAGRAAQAWFDATQAKLTACLIAPANIPSLRLAERLGYREVDRFVPQGRDPARKIVALVRDCGGA